MSFWASTWPVILSISEESRNLAHEILRSTQDDMSATKDLMRIGRQFVISNATRSAPRC